MERFDRLLEEQRECISQTEKMIEKLENSSLEYDQLKKKLIEVSHSFSKKTMVPFSPKALVSARLVHTNEVLVYLGGSTEHFCEVSTLQSVAIIDKRIERIHEEINRLQGQRKLLFDREKYTAKLVNGEQPHALNEENGQNEVVEIREDFDEEREKSWQDKHKKSLRNELVKERVTREAVALPPLTDESSEGSSSSSSYFPDITVTNSVNPALPVRPNFRDWYSASPADVVAHVQKFHKKGILKPAKTTPLAESVSTKPPPPPPATMKSPFSQVVERSPFTSADNEHTVPTQKPVSRFRASKNKGV